MKLTDAELRATGTNVSGYLLFRSSATLRIDAGAPVGSARITCSMHAHGGTEVAQTPGLRASYPRSSDDLIEQPAYEVSLVEFSSHGTGLAVVEIEDLPDAYATEPGIKLEWPTYKIGLERWRWFLPPGPPAKELVLPFTTIWKATKVPADRDRLRADHERRRRYRRNLRGNGEAPRNDRRIGAPQASAGRRDRPRIR